MAEDSLFLGLPPPSATPRPPPPSRSDQSSKKEPSPSPAPVPAPAPAPILKSALKRAKPPTEATESQPDQAAAVSQKRLRFKTTVDASETQIIEAMQKISSHIKNSSKFSKASKLTMQLVQSGSVKPGTSDHFFAILEAAMSSDTPCTDPSVRANYHALFTTAQEVSDLLTKKQKSQLCIWTIRAVLGNDLHTDDSFVFSKAATRVKEAISSLPVATKDDDTRESEALQDEIEAANVDGQDQETMPLPASSELNEKAELDPFGLDALLPGISKRDEKAKVKKEAADLSKRAEEESKRFLMLQREALIICLEVAAHRYRLPWCQTVIDILVKHAFDNIDKFTSRQRDAIGKLWNSIREQQARRKQGRSVTGKLDMNGFEWLQQKYAGEKISIRRAVGGGGERNAEQWLG